MPKKKITKAEQAETEKPARKNLPKPAKPEVSGGLSAREAERSLWAPRVESKAPRKKK